MDVLIALPPDTGVFGGAEFMARGQENVEWVCTISDVIKDVDRG